MFAMIFHTAVTSFAKTVDFCVEHEAKSLLLHHKKLTLSPYWARQALSCDPSCASFSLKTFFNNIVVQARFVLNNASFNEIKTNNKNTVYFQKIPVQSAIVLRKVDEFVN